MTLVFDFQPLQIGSFLLSVKSLLDEALEKDSSLTPRKSQLFSLLTNG